MIRVSIDVDGGAVRPRLSVRAESIGRALEIAEEQNPGRALNVVFPLDPETFFVYEPASETSSAFAEIAA